LRAAEAKVNVYISSFILYIILCNEQSIIDFVIYLT